MSNQASPEHPQAPRDGGRARNNSTSLRRALAVLDVVAAHTAHPGGVSLTDLASGAGLNKSTLLRLLGPLCEHRLVVQNQQTGRYQLGSRTAYLGQIYLERLDLRGTAHDVLVSLVDAAGETAHLMEFEPPEAVYIDKVESPNTVRMISRIGSRQPMHSSAGGKAFLAWAGETSLARVLAAGLPAKTPNTLTDEHELRHELAATRARGYAIDEVENEAEIRCVGAPVFDHTGSVIAALSLSGPASRMTPDCLPALGRSVAAAAGEITRRLGGAPPAGRETAATR